jgi:hypothetical protein
MINHCDRRITLLSVTGLFVLLVSTDKWPTNFTCPTTFPLVPDNLTNVIVEACSTVWDIV